MSHNFPVPDGNCIRFTQETQQGNSYMLVNNHISTYLPFEFAGFLKSFSDMAQKIMSATYKGVAGGLRLPFRHNGTSCVPMYPSVVLKPHCKAKQAI